MPRVQVKINRRGVKELLGSEPIRRTVHEVAERVASRAGIEVSVVYDLSGHYRARSEVHDTRPGAVEREARDGHLARALNGA